MAASTITRDTLTDDTGTAANPAGDGTILDNDFLQNFIYARIDELLSGAGSYATLTLGGKLALEGTGTVMNLSGGVTGAQEIRITNTSAGTGNYAALNLGNDGGSSSAFVMLTASNYTAAGAVPQDGLAVRTSRVGGVSVAAEHGSGTVRFYAGGTTERLRIGTAGAVFINATSNANMTVGLTIQQGANDNEILAFKSSDVAHGITALCETDTYARFYKADAAGGGVVWEGLSELQYAVQVAGRVTTEDTTKGTTSLAAILIDASLKSGANITTMGADANMVAFRDNGTTRAIIDKDGDINLDATANQNAWDDHDDVGLLESYRVLTMRDCQFKQRFAEHLTRHQEILARTGVLTLNEDGHHFVSYKGMMGLLIDAIRQVDGRVRAQADQAADIDRRLRLLGA